MHQDGVPIPPLPLMSVIANTILVSCCNTTLQGIRIDGAGNGSWQGIAANKGIDLVCGGCNTALLSNRIQIGRCSFQGNAYNIEGTFHICPNPGKKFKFLLLGTTFQVGPHQPTFGCPLQTWINMPLPVNPGSSFPKAGSKV